MDLILSHNRPLNTALCNADGKPFYIVRTPPGFAHTKTTVISSVLPDYPDDKYFDLDTKHVDEDEDEDGESGPSHERNDNQQGLEELAKIHWKMIGSSTLEYRGKKLDSGEFLHSSWMDIFDLHCAFTASDGKSYKWVARPTTFSTIALETNDDARTPIAHHYRSNSGLIGHKHKAHLKIFPDGMHILDDIVVMFIYMDKVRKTRQNLLKVS